MTPEQQMDKALIGQLQDEVAEFEAVLWNLLESIPTKHVHSAIRIAHDLLAHRRLLPADRERLIAEYRQAQAEKEARV